MMKHRIGISGLSLCYLQYESLTSLQRDFPIQKKPHGVLDIIWEKWEEESTSKSKIQCILDPSAKLHTLGYWKIVV